MGMDFHMIICVGLQENNNMKINKEPTQKRLHELLDYNPETGIFVWKSRHDNSANGRWNGRWEGKKAGCIKCGRYKCIEISINFIKYMAARLAWIYMYGDILSADIQIDHKNCDALDNKIKNLRMATHSQNTQNRTLNKNKKLPKGISTQSHNASKFRTRITVNKKKIYLGTYDSLDEASYWHIYAAKYYHGEFARSG